MTKRANPHKKFAHELVASVAKEMAGCFYEELASGSDEFYKFYPKQAVFVTREWRRFIYMAKQQMSLMLGQETVPEWQKEQIFDALVKHASLPGNIDRRAAEIMIKGGDLPDMSKVH